MCSRRASSNVVRTSRAIWRRWPFTRIDTLNGLRGSAAPDGVAAFAEWRSRSVADMVETIVVVRKLRRFQLRRGAWGSADAMEQSPDVSGAIGGPDLCAARK